MVRLTHEERDYLRRAVSEARNTVECQGCGQRIVRTSERRRYCTRACANRHWHVRNGRGERGL